MAPYRARTWTPHVDLHLKIAAGGSPPFLQSTPSHSLSSPCQVDVLHGLHALLIAEFIPDDAVFAYWGKALNKSAAQILADAVIIHFIARHKPWETSMQELRGLWGARAPPELLAVYGRWYAAEAALCGT